VAEGVFEGLAGGQRSALLDLPEGHRRQDRDVRSGHAGDLGEGQAQAAQAISGVVWQNLMACGRMAALMADFVHQRPYLREYEQK
jgi:hypothetical protein